VLLDVSAISISPSPPPWCLADAFCASQMGLHPSTMAARYTKAAPPKVVSLLLSELAACHHPALLASELERRELPMCVNVCVMRLSTNDVEVIVAEYSPPCVVLDRLPPHRSDSAQVGDLFVAGGSARAWSPRSPCCSASCYSSLSPHTSNHTLVELHVGVTVMLSVN